MPSTREKVHVLHFVPTCLRLRPPGSNALEQRYGFRARTSTCPTSSEAQEPPPPGQALGTETGGQDILYCHGSTSDHRNPTFFGPHGAVDGKASTDSFAPSESSRMICWADAPCQGRNNPSSRRLEHDGGEAKRLVSGASLRYPGPSRAAPLRGDLLRSSRLRCLSNQMSSDFETRSKPTGPLGRIPHVGEAYSPRMMLFEAVPSVNHGAACITRATAKLTAQFLTA